ncbi:alpha/beta hydrolase [Nocardia sp. XZ_19_369]|uniref:alpha/beta hydrolase n=1 Tax=Nocardia sp. XZ_19_369 TaxID=2769487 RepID=UPI001E41E8A4|nr:alpha/beta hydrolase [Nocardia sp. XZ_19_369]
MLIRRTVLAVGLVVGVCSGAVTACTSDAEPASAVSWAPCSENAEFDCGTVTVPVDWEKPGGETIGIAVVRDRADEPSAKVGTLVSLPGGPGTSGVDEILKGGKFSAELRGRFDIVSLDPRGVKRSHPVRCDAGLAGYRPNFVPDLGGRIAEVHSYARDLAASCRQYTGALMEHLDAASVARDVEALRVAVGVDQISIYSRSYGTMPAQSYAELFPKRLRALLMDSVDDHSLDGRAFMNSEARAAKDAYGEFAAWCAREVQCVLHGADVDQIFGEVYAKSARGELRDLADANKQLGPFDLNAQVIQRLYRPEWSKLATDLRALVDQPAASPLPPSTPQQQGQAVPMAQVILCSDWRFDIADQDRWNQLWQEQTANAAPLRAHFAWGAGALCSGWPIAPANPAHLPQIADGPPLLIMNSLHDPSTPHEWALGVAKNTPNSTLLTYEGWGHGVYDRSPCTTSAADRYLIDLTIPQTRCPAA